MRAQAHAAKTELRGCAKKLLEEDDVEILNHVEDLITDEVLAEHTGKAKGLKPLESASKLAEQTDVKGKLKAPPIAEVESHLEEVKTEAPPAAGPSLAPVPKREPSGSRYERMSKSAKVEKLTKALARLL